MKEPEITVTATTTGRLRAAYPASRHDVELRVEGVASADMSAVLAREAAGILERNPHCRRVVYAAPLDDLETIASAERAGFRYVVDVDVNDEGEVLELVLLVCEQEPMSALGQDLDRVPGS